MKGLENEWNYVGKRRYATYSKLPPGEYTFRVKGSNNDGVWNEEGASINIIISPPFWETWWFRIASIVAILAFSLGVYKVRTYSIRKRSEQLKEINIKLNEQISIRKKTEETIRESENLLRTIISVTKDAMIVIGTDGLISMFNPAAEKVFGRTSKEMIGQPLDILMPEEYREKHHGYVKGYFDTGEPHNAIGKILELPALHSDGHIFLMEISLSSGSHGEKPFVIAAARNITERKKAEEALRMSERSLSEAQRISHLGNWDLDLVKNELRWSDEIYRIFGLKPQEFGANYEAFLDAVHPDDREFVDTSYTNSVKNNTPYDIIHRIVKSDGEVRYVHEKAEDIKDERGETIRSIGTVQDITERKQAEEQIKASLREKDVLLQEIHHRVKNNMQIISSLIKLQSRHIKDEQALETFMSTQNRVLSMAIIHDRLYRSKDFARVDFAEYALSLANHLFSVYGIDLSTTKLKTDIKDIFLDINTAIPCGLIINELVSNSLKHAFPDSKKGEIKITMRALNKKEIELTVTDNGIGLPKDIDIRKTESLGLHLVTILAEDQLHGKIKLDRTEGTSFQIKLRVKQ
jgi:PAS domain S-box-containing protein